MSKNTLKEENFSIFVPSVITVLGIIITLTYVQTAINSTNGKVAGIFLVTYSLFGVVVSLRSSVKLKGQQRIWPIISIVLLLLMGFYGYFIWQFSSYMSY